MAKGNNSWVSSMPKTEVVRRLTLSFLLGKVTLLITPTQSEWAKYQSILLFCTDM